MVEVGKAEERGGQRKKDQGRAESQNNIKDSKIIRMNQCLEIYLTRGMKCLYAETTNISVKSRAVKIKC